MTGRQLWEEYQKLPEDEKIKFEKISVKSKEKLKEENEMRRRGIVNKLMSVKDKDGNPYFHQEYLEKTILKKDQNDDYDEFH